MASCGTPPPHAPIGENHLPSHNLRTPNHKRPTRPHPSLELRAGDRRPPALPPNPRERLHIPRIERLPRLLGRVGHEPDRMPPTLELLGGMPCPASRLSIQIDQRPKSPRLPANDRHHQGKPQLSRAHK